MPPGEGSDGGLPQWTRVCRGRTMWVWRVEGSQQLVTWVAEVIVMTGRNGKAIAAVMPEERSRFDVALGVAGLAFAAVALGTAIWTLATGDSVPGEVPAESWFLVGVVMVGIVTMVITTVRYRERYRPSPQGGLIVAGWIVAALAGQLSLFAWGDDPHMSFAEHLTAAAEGAAVAGWLAFGLCAVAILRAVRRTPASVEVQDDESDLIDHR